MSLRALLADVDAGWFDDAGTTLDSGLATQARGSALGPRGAEADQLPVEPDDLPAAG